ncbi:MAG TPA: hypothetical protein VMK84_04360 [Streptosporangiaceae bacterium]|nr:hypothetical protein [Streptosporangiaceae bacterium]
MSSCTCSLCGLRYPAQSLLDLRIREDHAQRAEKPAAPAPVRDPAPDPAPAPAPPQRASWAETARRALNKMIGRAA